MEWASSGQFDSAESSVTGAIHFAEDDTYYTLSCQYLFCRDPKPYEQSDSLPRYPSKMRLATISMQPVLPPQLPAILIRLIPSIGPCLEMFLPQSCLSMSLVLTMPLSPRINRLKSLILTILQSCFPKRKLGSRKQQRRIVTLPMCMPPLPSKVIMLMRSHFFAGLDQSQGNTSDAIALLQGALASNSGQLYALL